MNKDWFISQYNGIHENLHFLEKEIEKHLENKKDLIGKDEVLEDLKNRTLIEIERLNNTRKNEREIFNY
jgi:hypothetical protein